MKTLSIPNDILIPQIKRVIDEGKSVTFLVKGYSMRLFLDNNRDKVILAPCEKDKVKPGDVVLAEVSKDVYVLHRIIKRTADSLILKGDGNIKGTETCRTSDVIGIAIGFYRKGRNRPDLVTGWKWKAYSFIWQRLSPVRRYILAVYRRMKKEK